MFCGKCGAELPDDALFCVDCGIPIGRHSPAVKSYKTDSGKSIQFPVDVTIPKGELVKCVCSNCGFEGKMWIVQRTNVNTAVKLVINVVGIALFFAVGWFVEFFFLSNVPVWVLSILGILLMFYASRKVDSFIRDISIDNVLCLKCRSVLTYHKINIDIQD